MLIFYRFNVGNCEDVVPRTASLTVVLFLQWKVRRTLAFSIHELGMILGKEITMTDLVPIFNGFLRDLDEVRVGVLKHLADFLKVRFMRVLQKPSNVSCRIHFLSVASRLSHITEAFVQKVCESSASTLEKDMYDGFKLTAPIGRIMIVLMNVLSM